MAKQIDIEVIEDEKELQSLLRKTQSNLVRHRVKALFLIKRDKCKYTKDVAIKTGYSRKTIYNWLGLYKQKGIKEFCKVNSGGNNTKLLSQNTKDQIATLLKDPYSTIVSYVELLAILQQTQPELNYNAVYKHCLNHHGSKLKVARKSHHKKDEQVVKPFKKTAQSTI